MRHHDFTDADKPFEIGFFDAADRRPADGGRPGRPADAISRQRGTIGGSGAPTGKRHIYSSEMARGPTSRAVPNEHLSANEIAAASS